MGKPWTREEDELLKRESFGKTYIEVQKLLPHRTLSAVTCRCQGMKLNDKGMIMGNKQSWNKCDIDFLVKNHGIVAVEEIANQIHKTPKQVEYRIRQLGINCQKIWSKEEVEVLKNNCESKDAFQIMEMLEDKSVRQIHKKISNFGLKLKAFDRKSKVATLNDVFSNYKKVLNGEGVRIRVKYPKEYDILLFKYYLIKNNITPTKEWVLNIHFTKFLTECHLRSSVKKKWRDCYEFITACFPSYGIKEYEFKSLQVREGFWLKDYNCYCNIKKGVIRAISDGTIDHPSGVLHFDINTIYKYFHKSMIYFRGVQILSQFLEYYNFDFNKSKYWKGHRFDSSEEMSVFKYIYLNHFDNIQKYDGGLIRNEIAKEGYIPDFLIETQDKNIIIEYFGLYKESHSKWDVISDYKNKTHRKIEFYDEMSECNFIYLYPEDLKDDFRGVSEKLAPFLL